MKEKEKSLLKEAISEIRNLRRQNEVLGARLSGFDDALTLLRTQPFYPGQGMSPDLTYSIEKHLVSIEEEEKHLPQAARCASDESDSIEESPEGLIGKKAWVKK